MNEIYSLGSYVFNRATLDILQRGRCRKRISACVSDHAAPQRTIDNREKCKESTTYNLVAVLQDCESFIFYVTVNSLTDIFLCLPAYTEW